ncbi:MAG: hypothetical protein M3020_15395, partial [Myxococcota bacterium]|nr:hypothetical protein [Myxococcota bacterium]
MQIREMRWAVWSGLLLSGGISLACGDSGPASNAELRVAGSPGELPRTKTDGAPSGTGGAATATEAPSTSGGMATATGGAAAEGGAA